VRASTLPETDLPLTVMATEMVIYSSPLPRWFNADAAKRTRRALTGLSQAGLAAVKRIAD
jgi:S-formylglutathione hydrolase FrmB